MNEEREKQQANHEGLGDVMRGHHHRKARNRLLEYAHPVGTGRVCCFGSLTQSPAAYRTGSISVHHYQLI
jgi:hypothetical protein